MRYQPNLEKVWDRNYPMASPPAPYQLYSVDRQFELGKEWARCRERPILRFVTERDTIELEFGPQCAIPSAVLAPLSALTTVKVVLASYRKQADDRTVSEPASGIRIRFESGPRWMTFLRSDWGADTFYTERAFLAELEELAEAAGADYRQSPCRHQLSYDFPPV